MHGGTLRGRWIDGHGHPQTVHISANELLDILLAGDFNPILRAEFPAAARAADTATPPRSRGCSREPPERRRRKRRKRRDRRAAAPHHHLRRGGRSPGAAPPAPTNASPRPPPGSTPCPRAAIAPFTPANMLDFDELRTCAFWPFATPAPPVVPDTMPDVPTLILSGADDLRTPTANARAVAAQIPDAHLLVVPNTGHSVLESEPTHARARRCWRCSPGGWAYSRSRPAPPGRRRPWRASTPLPPERLSDVPPAHGNSRRAGRTLQAVELTLADFARQFALQLLETSSGAGGSSGIVSSSLDTGGLRAGWAQLTKGGLRFHGYSYVPGVTISGKIKAESVTLRIGGSAAAHGTLRLGPHKALVGELGGRRVHLNRSSPTATAAIVGSDAQASLALGLRGSAVRAAARRLAGLLSSLPWD